MSILVYVILTTYILWQVNLTVFPLYDEKVSNSELLPAGSIYPKWNIEPEEFTIAGKLSLSTEIEVEYNVTDLYSIIY